MTADDHLRAGDLDAARAELVARIKGAPSDQGARMFLFQLLCVCGEWDKAIAQLRALAALSPEAQMLSSVYAQAIEAEKLRLAAFSGQGAVPVLAGEEPWMQHLAASIAAFAQGRGEEGENLRDAAFDQAPDAPGEADGEAFDWIADADGRFGPAFEAIVYGRWGLIPFCVVESIAFEPTKDLRDVVWAPAQMRLKTGLSAAVLLPARYPGSEAADADARLGRATRWRQGASGEEGVGQRLFAFDRGEDAGLLALSKLSFA